MDDARRFLRHVPPGVIFLCELALLVYLADRDFLSNCIAELDLPAFENPKLTDWITAGAGLLVTTPIVGVLLHTLYHGLVELPWIRNSVGPNFNKTFEDAVKYIDWGGTKPVFNGEDGVSKAWLQFTAAWYELIEVSKKAKGSHARVLSYADIHNGVCTGLVGCILAIVIGFTAWFGGMDCLRFMLLLVIGLALFFLHFRAVMRIRDEQQHLLHGLFLDALHEYCVEEPEAKPDELGRVYSLVLSNGLELRCDPVTPKAKSTSEGTVGRKFHLTPI